MKTTDPRDELRDLIAHNGEHPGRCTFGSAVANKRCPHPATWELDPALYDDDCALFGKNSRTLVALFQSMVVCDAHRVQDYEGQWRRIVP